MGISVNQFQALSWWFGYPLALGIPSENTLVFWVSLVIYIKSNRNSISLLCISLHWDIEEIVLFTIKIKDSSNYQINDLWLMSFFLNFFDSKISVTANLYCGLVSIKTEEVSLCLQLILKIVRTSQSMICDLMSFFQLLW